MYSFSLHKVQKIIPSFSRDNATKNYVQFFM